MKRGHRRLKHRRLKQRWGELWYYLVVLGMFSDIEAVRLLEPKRLQIDLGSSGGARQLPKANT